MDSTIADNEYEPGKFLLELGEHIKTDKDFYPPDIQSFKKFLNQELLPTLSNKYTAFLYGSFTHDPNANDIDIAVIGKPTDEVALWMINMYNVCFNQYRQQLDMTLFEDMTVFEPYELFNRTKDASVLNNVDVYKPYDKTYLNGKDITFVQRKTTKISDVLYKHHTSRELPSRKFLYKDMYPPMELTRFNQVFNNVR